MNKQSHALFASLTFTALLLIAPQTLFSAIVVDPDSVGATDVDPTDPSTWTSDTYGYVGKSSDGAVLVDGGSVVECNSTNIGFYSGSSGEVTVDGGGSSWDCVSGLYVGSSGSGTLTITNGGSVNAGYYSSIGGWESGGSGVVTVDGSGSNFNCDDSLYVGDNGSGTLAITNGADVYVGLETIVGSYAGLTGSIDFGTSGGTLTTGGLSSSPTQLSGTGTIDTRGLVSDVDLVFDATHGLIQTLTLNGPGQNITINLDVSGTNGDTGELGAGYQGNGSLVIKDGVSVTSSSGSIARHAGSNGTVTIDGGGSTWTCEFGIYVGEEGIGTLSITNGGTVNVGEYAFIGGWNSASSGVVTVDGSGSAFNCVEWFSVGEVGNGVVNITNGGVVSVEGITYLAYYEGSLGTIDFGSGGGTLATGSLLGSPSQFAGTGTVNTRGLVSDVDLLFDATHGLTQTLTFNGSGRNVTVNLDVSGTSGVTDELGAGYLGNGSLTIRDGVSITSTYGDIGYHAGSNGVAKVDGTGSTWICEEGLAVGGGGSGTLLVTNGGEVGVGYYVDIGGWYSGASGEVTVDGAGSILSCGEGIYIGSGGNGTLKIVDGGAVSSGGYSGIGGWGPESSGAVTVNGIGSRFTCTGSLDVGDAGDGLLRILNGGLVSVDETLGISAFGEGSGFIDIYNGGVLALLGDYGDSPGLFLSMIDGDGEIRYWDNSLMGWFDISGATQDDDYTLSYQTTGDLMGYTLLTVLAALAGDANGDGDVDVSDLGVLATNYGTTSGAEWSDADFNGDGAVDVSDLGVLATKYGSSTAGEPTEAVPEPCGMVLIVMGAVGLLGYVRRRRR